MTNVSGLTPVEPQAVSGGLPVNFALPHNNQSDWFQNRFQAAAKSLKLKEAFIVEFPEDVRSLSEVYLDSFPNPVHRQYYNCKTCKHVIDTIGCAVYVNESTGELIPALWNIDDLIQVDGADEDQRYWTTVINNLHDHIVTNGLIVNNLYPTLLNAFCNKRGEYVYGAPIKGIRKDGVAAQWDHISAFYSGRSTTGIATGLPETVGQVKQNIHDYKDDVLNHALTLLENDDTLKTRTTQIKNLQMFIDTRKLILSVTNRRLRNNLYWLNAVGKGVVIAHFGNTVLGEFIKMLMDGKDKEPLAIRRFLEQTHPENYMRATEAPSEGNVQTAMRIVSDLGVEKALVNRRQCAASDILEYVFQTTAPVVEEAAPGSIFDGLAKSKSNKVASFDKPSFDKTLLPKEFINVYLLGKNVVSLEVNVPYRCYFHGYTTAIDPNDGIIYRWDSAERRNTVAGYTYTQPSTPDQFGLKQGWTSVVGVTRNVCDWFTQTGVEEGLLVVNAGPYKPCAVCLFANTLIPELYPVRSTMEALMIKHNGTSIDNGVAGIPITGGISIRLETDTARFNITIGTVR